MGLTKDYPDMIDAGRREEVISSWKKELPNLPDR